MSNDESVTQLCIGEGRAVRGYYGFRDYEGMLIQGNKVLSKYDKPLLLGTATANRQATPASVINEEYVKRRPNLGQKKVLLEDN